MRGMFRKSCNLYIPTQSELPAQWVMTVLLVVWENTNGDLLLTACFWYGSSLFGELRWHFFSAMFIIAGLI